MGGLGGVTAGAAIGQRLLEGGERAKAEQQLRRLVGEDKWVAFSEKFRRAQRDMDATGQSQRVPVLSGKLAAALDGVYKQAADPVNQATPAALGVTPTRHLPQSKVTRKLHGVSEGSPRVALNKAISTQSAHRPEYHSTAGMSLLQRRHLDRGRSLPLDGGDGQAVSGSGVAAVPKQIPTKGVNQNFYRELGYPAISNHELEHAYDQKATSPLEKRINDVELNYSNADSNRELADYKLRQLPKVKIPTSLPDPNYTGFIEARSKIERLRDAHHEAATRWSRTWQQEGLEQSRNLLQDKEVGPSVGDLVFRGEQFAREEGKPLQHQVQLPGGKTHDINWMREQAKQHGYCNEEH